MKTFTIDQLVEAAVKQGFNRKEATGAITRGIDSINKYHSNKTPKKAAWLAMMIY